MPARPVAAGTFAKIAIGISGFVSEFNSYPLGINRRGFRNGVYPEHGIDWYDALNRNAFHLPPLHEQPNGIILLPTNGVWHCPSAQRPGVWDQDPHWKTSCGWNTVTMKVDWQHIITT